jgi:hypothetical protein
MSEYLLDVPSRGTGARPVGSPAAGVRPRFPAAAGPRPRTPWRRHVCRLLGDDCNPSGPFGTYQWAVSGLELTLTPMIEPCPDRGGILTGNGRASARNGRWTYECPWRRSNVKLALREGVGMTANHATPALGQRAKVSVECPEPLMGRLRVLVASTRGAYGIRTRAAAVRGRCPRPLDECAGRPKLSE